MKAVFEKKADLRFSGKHIQGLKAYPPMFHTHCEFVYVLDGEIKMMVDGHEHLLKAGELAMVFPYVIHSYESAPHAEAYLYMFDPSSVQLFESELLSRKPIDPVLPNAHTLAPLFLKILKLTSDDDSLKHRTANAYLCALMGELLHTISLCDVEITPENMIKPILNYCYDHFSDEDISIKSVAKALYISDSYVSKVFSNKLKYKFREYINSLRISHAKKLLSHTDMKIVEIMTQCGYKNQSSFNRIFSDIVKLSPSEYRALKKKLL